jgi:hypothetical protein
MRLLVFSDLHGDRAGLELLLDTEADVYIAAGDLSDWGRGLDGMATLLTRRAPHVWVLPGNHEHASRVEELCSRHGLNSMHGRVFEHSGWRFAGLGHSTPTPFNTPGESSEEQFAASLALLAGNPPDILVCHSPPLGTSLDQAGPGRHFGSWAIREFIENHPPHLFFCGHIHEAAGRELKLGSTLCFNAGRQGRLVELPARRVA